LAILSLVGLLLSVWMWVGYTCKRRKRLMLRLCLKCGYDLRGSKNRCPECGQEFETA